MAEVDMKLANFAIDKLNQTVEMNKRLQQQSDIAVRSLNNRNQENRVKNYRNLVNDETDDIKQMFDITKDLNLSDAQKAQMFKATGANYKTTEAQNAAAMFSTALTTSADNNKIIFDDFQNNIVKAENDETRYNNILNFKNNVNYDKNSQAYKNLKPRVDNYESDFILSKVKSSGQLALDAVPFLSAPEKAAYSKRLGVATTLPQVDEILDDALTRGGRIGEMGEEERANFIEKLLSGDYYSSISQLSNLSQNADSPDVKFIADGGINLMQKLASKYGVSPEGDLSIPDNTPVTALQPKDGETFSFSVGDKKADRIPVNAKGQIIAAPSLGVSGIDAERIKQHFKANPRDYEIYKERIQEAYPNIPVPAEINY